MLKMLSGVDPIAFVTPFVIQGLNWEIAKTQKMIL